ncbi:MAG: RnfABCDGE type electron transport complex subunit D [Spirochaetales bacterium]|uniref:RnfABCDGE type electron transport complex subunit D n=1 Tax=Candidatus Thalassospirochaeta sargassi TaxID=3119039 RepID=A0AAJ1MIP9_9SPIO|nr:RnfABCDGE type electron transport complex subunit D [Spirochaetales bacterium]
METDKPKKPLIQKQKVMNQVLYALIPIAVFSVYLFGWRSLSILIVVNIAGFLSEYIFARIYKKQVSTAVFVTNFLFALSLPPAIPYWIAVVGIVFGVVFGKMVFGGFGRNVFNPAISGRAFIYISFGGPLTAGFVQPAAAGGGFPGGFAQWLAGADAVSRATPILELNSGGGIPLLNLITGLTAGSLGETCAILIIAGGIFLMIKKAANWRIVVSGILGFLVMQGALFFAGVEMAVNPVYGLFSGSLLYGIMFMATDPISSSQTTDGGRWIYGAVIGVLISLIRVFSIWVEGVTFAILLANMFAPLLDHMLKERKKRLKAKSAASGTAAAGGEA